MPSANMKAEPLFQRSLKIWEKTLGPDHPDVANALEAYADLRSKMGRAKEVASLRARAEAIKKKNKGDTIMSDASR